MKTGSQVVAGGGEIEVRFSGTPVPRVTRTIAFFWNAGRESIRSEDVRKPVTLQVPDGVLLRATLLRTTRPEIHAELELEGQAATLSFSHLDRGDGCCVELVHTSEDPLGVSCDAVIIGVRSGLTYLASPFWDDPAGLWMAVAISMAGVTIVTGSALGGSWGGALAGLVMTAFGVRLSWSSRRHDRRYLPREFWDLPVPQNPRAVNGITGWRIKD